MTKRLLILSRSENTHSDAVQELFLEHGTVQRIDFDFDNKQPSIVKIGTNNTDKNYYSSVFIHHPRISYFHGKLQDDIARKLYVASWNSFQEWVEGAFPNAVFINKPSVIYTSRSLLRQFNLARDLRLEIPETLFTNSLCDLVSFVNNSLIVIKQGNLGVHIENSRILTTMINVSAINEIELFSCPCLFQRYIEKAYELRIHVIGNNVYTCKIESQENENTKVDWRNYDIENTPHSIFILPREIEDKCRTLVAMLGLSFGVIDMIVTPENKYVFLECNSQAHWLWIEELVGLPITRSLVQLLLNNSIAH